MSKTIRESKPGEGEFATGWYSWGALAAIVLLAVVIFEPALVGPFLFDDLYMLPMQPEAASKPLPFWLIGNRPLVNFTYWVNTQLSGVSAPAFHWTNLLIHLVNTGLVWRIARHLLRAPGGEGVRPGLVGWAPLPALIFLVHPLQTEAVSYISGRAEILAGTFFLLAWWVFARQKEEGLGWGETGIVVGLFALSVLAKEHVVVLPVVLLLTGMHQRNASVLATLRGNGRLFGVLGVGAVLGVAYVFRMLSAANSVGFHLADANPVRYFWTQCEVLWGYLRLFAWPLGLNADHDVPLAPVTGQATSWLGLAGLAGLLGLAWRSWQSYRLASLAMALFFVLLAPTSSVVPIDDPMAERRMYLAVFALGLGLLQLLVAGPLAKSSQGTKAGVAAVGLLALSGLTWQRNQAWGAETALWRSAAEASPNKVRPHFQLGYALYKAGECDEALTHFGRAATLAPANYQLNLDWALAADCAGKANLALDRIDKAIGQEKSGQALSTKAMILAKQNRFAEALQVLDEAQKVDPAFAMTYYYRGNVYLAQDKFDEAIAAYDQAAQVQPGWREAIDASANARRSKMRAERLAAEAAAQKKP